MGAPLKSSRGRFGFFFVNPQAFTARQSLGVSVFSAELTLCLKLLKIQHCNDLLKVQSPDYLPWNSLTVRGIRSGEWSFSKIRSIFYTQKSPRIKNLLTHQVPLSKLSSGGSFYHHTEPLLDHLTPWSLLSVYNRILSLGKKSTHPCIYRTSTKHLLTTYSISPPSSGINNYRNLIFLNKDSGTINSKPVAYGRSSTGHSLAIHRAAPILTLLGLAKFSMVNLGIMRFKLLGRGYRYGKRVKKLSLFFRSLKYKTNHSWNYKYDNLFLQSRGRPLGPTFDKKQGFLLKSIAAVYRSRFRVKLSPTQLQGKLLTTRGILNKSKNSSNRVNFYKSYASSGSDFQIRYRRASDILLGRLFLLDLLSTDSSFIKFLY